MKNVSKFFDPQEPDVRAVKLKDSGQAIGPYNLRDWNQDVGELTTKGEIKQSIAAMGLITGGTLAAGSVLALVGAATGLAAPMALIATMTSLAVGAAGLWGAVKSHKTMDKLDGDIQAIDNEGFRQTASSPEEADKTIREVNEERKHFGQKIHHKAAAPFMK